MKQYSVGDYTFTGALVHRDRDAAVLVRAARDRSSSPSGPKDVVPPRASRSSTSVGLHSRGQTGFNLDYFRHLALPVLDADRAEHRGVEPVPARVDARRAVDADYIRTARAKGVPRRKVIFKHAFRNALIPLVTVIALDTAFLFGGLIITEQIFSIPGMGRLFLDALAAGDAPVLARAGSSSPRSSSSCSTCSPTCSTACSTRGSGSHDAAIPKRSVRGPPAIRPADRAGELGLDSDVAPSRSRSGSCSGGGSSATSVAVDLARRPADPDASRASARRLARARTRHEQAGPARRRRPGPTREALVRHRRARPRPAQRRCSTPARSR